MASVHGSGPSDSARELLESARQLRWRAPELTLMLSDRVVTESRRDGDGVLRSQAEALALFASNRLGHGVTVTERAITAMRDAEFSGDAAGVAELCVELACCARGAGSHDVALRLLRSVLERGHVDPVVRVHALIELAAALPVHRGASERAAALDEAERLCSADSELDRDTVRLLRARVGSERACHHRRHGEAEAAATAAGNGLALLERLEDPAAEGGDVQARLVLERVQALLDLGFSAEAMRTAAPVLWRPLRAPAADPAGWLRFALATRVHVPEGEYRIAMRLLNEALAGAERHGLDHLRAEVLSTLSQLHERCEDFAEALHCLRDAHAADRRWRAGVHAARLRLVEEFATGAPEMAGMAVPRQQESPSRESRGDVPPVRDEPHEASAVAPSPREEMLPDLAHEIRRAARREPEEIERSSEIEVGRQWPAEQDTAASGREQGARTSTGGYPEGRGPAPWERPSETGFEAEAPMPDVTTIMPVVAAPPLQGTGPPAHERAEQALGDVDGEARANRFEAGESAETHDSDTGGSGGGTWSPRRSLAEIRAGLQNRRSPGEGETGQYDSRHREEAETPEAVSGDDFLATHSELLQGLPAIKVGRQDSESHGENGLADLLAEALVAYRGGRHGDSGASSAVSRHAGADTDESTDATRSARYTQESTGESVAQRGRARRRHAAPESTSADSSSWTPPIH
ncbi:tetratricopeptide (TPR) repeat protein [Saccharopolyspora lacisalsi]|uniref:Tetratricopeptide (TPR) repeat protein n=1 Tax=Halosaccharopolyspora lacisalsi TaxID=1000566 RepID=A0A839E1Q3_9PSEU|nr:hypothetical protein [Halosaccharopolyspora lacisalsi]MBA8825331.1 tetratricopeptide (TPR) repeat protein [Halosaccharopolyspora lacisalsi]